MPRKTIDIGQKIEYLSILDEKGKLDEKLAPDLDGEFLLKLYRAMVMGRKFDERLLNLQRQGRIGTFAPISGQEAAQLGAVAVLREDDWMVPSFREMAAELWRGRSLESVILAYGGYNEAAREGDAGRTLPVAIPVGSQILHAAGLGWACRYRGEDSLVLTYFGDGATSEGDFHEGINFAGVFESPVIFLCQNNHWAISMPRSRQTRSGTIAQKAVAYGIPGIQVDGNDLLAVYVAVSEAAERARAGKGPTLVECVTYRMSMHTTADDPKKYRPEKDVEGWRKKDPIERFEKYLVKKKVLDKKKIEATAESVMEEIQKAVDSAERKMKSFTDPLLMFDHAYAETPRSLERQREELVEELDAAGKESADE
ncbi:MAG: pyruvate dehydrogenase (acetyl-transferring) E1 component subunit alpha [Desulfobacterales bacterium]